jgi:drug/metabolite transporter (DMT)-like permease
LAFGEKPDLWTWVGAAVIVSSSVYITHRESQQGHIVSSAKSVNIEP